MKHLLSPWLLGLALLAFTTFSYFFYFGGGPEQKAYEIYNPAFDSYLSAYTEGIISKKSSVIVRFSKERSGEAPLNQGLEKSPFAFQPAIEGEAIWVDNRTLKFIPKEMLPSGQVYQADLNMAAIIEDIPDSLSYFKFQFMSRKQYLKVKLAESEVADEKALTWHQVKGEVNTADYATDKAIEDIFKAQKNGEKLAIKWQHYADEQRHVFTIDSIERTESEASVLLAWNGEGIGMEMKEERKLLVPAKNQFLHTNIKISQSPEQQITVVFSDPINPGQDLEGLVHLGEHAANWVVSGNTIKLFPKRRLEGVASVVIEPGIENLLGHKTMKRIEKKVTFDPIDPQVELIGKGTILPSTGGKLPFLFKAVGLNAVDIRVIKIFEENVPQFLQVNNLDDSQELKRVGKQILRKRIDLSNSGLDLLEWNVHSIDLSQLMQQEPGAIYEVAVGFNKDYALCDCSGTNDTGTAQDMLGISKNWDKYVGYESSYWDYYSNGYRYSDKDDPCLHAYYNYDRVARRNVLASDLGIIAKKGTRGEMMVVVTNLQNTEPLSGVSLELLDYQQQSMGTAQTNSSGIAEMMTNEVRPFLLVAKRGEQRGYLKLDDGLSLSLSRFDTQGSDYHKGVKGFIYAERGVWRPGDIMHINFILEDKGKALPANHPVNFQLKNPQGQIVKNVTKSDHVNNFYSFPTSTDPDAPTGNYSATVSVGGAVFNKTMKVESIMPNRLKVKLDFGKESLSVKDESLNGSLDVKWLHGAIAKNLKTKVEVTLTQSTTSFPKYQNFIFDDPVRKFNAESKTIFDGKVDEMGHADIPAKLAAKRASPGQLTANFKTKAFEPGGNFSIDRFAIPYHPYDTYVGVELPKGDRMRGMLLTDTDHDVKIVTLDPEGNPVSKSGLEVNLYKIEWRWWWNQSEQENLADYRGKMHKSPIQTSKVNTTNGEGNWKLNVAYPSWGRYLVRVCDGDSHCTGKIVYIDWPGWAGRGQKDNPGGASMLLFSADKEAYEVGEEVTLNLPTPEAGRALVTIESGSRVLKTEWVNAEKGTTRFSFKTTPEMAPNVYANVLLVQPHQQTTNDLPMRMYGVIPLKVENPQTKLRPMIAMNDELGPMEDVTVSISESDGREMTYTLAVVDEGLLDLTRFETPSPWHTFYKREALKVKTWDLFDDVIGAYGGEVKSLLSIGGDGAAPRADDAKQDRFKPVVVVMGPYTLEPGASKKHTFKMPNYVGSVRTMVVAGDTKGAYGSTEKATPVKKPLMALATLPRVLGPGESFDLPVTIFAMEEGISNVKVSVEGDGLVSLAGLTTKNVRFNEVGEEMVSFSMKARSAIGKGTVKVMAVSGRHIAKYEVDVEVRTPNPRVTNVYASAIEPNGEWKQSYTPVGMAGTNNGALEVSSIPPLNLAKRLRYLIRYPYGCIEQTTSSGFPQVYLSKLLTLSDNSKAEISTNVKAAIGRIKLFQVSEGGFSYWPGELNSSEWGTNYGGHFLLEAQAAGYTIPSNMLNKWKEYQAKTARRWTGTDYGSQLMQSYRLYLLALAKAPEMGAMNRMRNQNGLTNVARWNLAAAYHLAGQVEVAQEIAQTAGMDVKNYNELGYTYGSTLRDQAIILQALSIMGNRTKAMPLVQEISKKLSEEQWMSTQTTAYSLVAMAKYVGEGGATAGMKFSYRINGGKWDKVSVDKPVWQYDLPSVGGDVVEFMNDSGAMLYARVVLDGIPQAGDVSASSEGLSLNVQYLDMTEATLDPVNIVQGTDFMVKVTVKNTGVRGDYEELALAHILPSGWEIHNNRLDMQGNYKGDKPEYQDIRDDRVYTFFDLKQGQQKTFVVLLNASYKGKYYLPTIATEAMYDKGINARVPGMWVNVVGDN